jgi:hypothetical protein
MDLSLVEKFLKSVLETFLQPFNSYQQKGTPLVYFTRFESLGQAHLSLLGSTQRKFYSDSRHVLAQSTGYTSRLDSQDNYYPRTQHCL